MLNSGLPPTLGQTPLLPNFSLGGLLGFLLMVPLLFFSTSEERSPLSIPAWRRGPVLQGALSRLRWKPQVKTIGMRQMTPDINKKRWGNKKGRRGEGGEPHPAAGVQDVRDYHEESDSGRDEEAAPNIEELRRRRWRRDLREQSGRRCLVPAGRRFISQQVQPRGR